MVVNNPVKSDLERVTDLLRERSPQRISILTGAGISAESGVPTFRGPGGLWENHRPENLATPEAFERDPELVWRWYEWRRALIAGVHPNAGHEAIARLELSLPPGAISVITQNVDGLHRRAGTKNLLELHGSITRVRCISEGASIEHPEPFAGIPPRCSCGSLLRPDVVWFGEPLEEGIIERAAELVANSDLVLVVGTSGVVYPAAGLVHAARKAIVIEINPDETPLSEACRFAVRSGASSALPAIVAAILGEGPAL